MLEAEQQRTPIERLVYGIAPRYAVDPELALAMISVESNFDPAAVSPKNAQGLMQLIPETAQRFGVKRVFDPVDNINGGLAYIRWLLAFFKGNVQLVIAAYNAGEGAVEKYRGIPPFAETRRYVQKITGMYRRAKHPYNEQVVPPSPLVADTRRAAN
jgi:soluble lytic murein transglycosylase-like protein